jgi:bifunctional NMN adenylyltransferase/nudix hydrolase
MRTNGEDFDVGVIVGRFQVPQLHDAHRELIEHVCSAHDKVVIFLGLSPIPGTRENPLDFQARRQMLSEAFPQVEVLYIKDMVSDAVWSDKLDGMIEDVVTPHQTVCLYGGRESFIDRYHGSYKTCELISDRYINAGTEIRKQIAQGRTGPSADFRRGAVWNAYNRFPTAFATVDVAVFDMTKILLVRKPYEDQWRLPGGFVEPGTTLEANARREVQEETGVAITDPVYVGSTPIDDWRYRNEVDKITTTLFMANRLSGSPRPDDDVAEARWFEVDEVTDKDLVPNHRVLMAMLKAWFDTNSAIVIS